MQCVGIPDVWMSFRPRLILQPITRPEIGWTKTNHTDYLDLKFCKDILPFLIFHQIRQVAKLCFQRRFFKSFQSRQIHQSCLFCFNLRLTQTTVFRMKSRDLTTSLLTQTMVTLFSFGWFVHSRLSELSKAYAATVLPLLHLEERVWW